MRFIKMHGAGNDYVYVDCFSQAPPGDPAGLARRVSDRHFGVGGDGLVLILPSAVADARMRMFNADGSEAEMCGNAVRCVAKYVFDHGLVRKPTLTVETGRGVLSLDAELAGERVARVRVDMGEPILQADKIPTTLAGSPVVNAGLDVGGRKLQVTCVSMGNPHCITFVDRLSDEWVLGIGPKVEVDPHFPKRVNAEFVEVVSPAEIRMRVWERGSGETLACGTGACATLAAAVVTGRSDRKARLELTGGTLDIEWDEVSNDIFMTGPAEFVFDGTVNL